MEHAIEKEFKVFFLKLVAEHLFVSLNPMHMGHGTERKLVQNVPRPIMKFYSKYEHLIMKAIKFLASWKLLDISPAFARSMDRLRHYLLKMINGEILTLEESKRMISAIDAQGETIAVGTCPCRRARNAMTDEIPNNTDMVFGSWAEEYLLNYPRLYRRLSKQEALDLVEDFDRHGFFHQVYGMSRKGAAYVLCNCSRDVCIPLEALNKRGFESFRRGRNVAVTDISKCKGNENCGKCFERCPFEARTVKGAVSDVDEKKCYGCGLCFMSCDSGATELIRREGADLFMTKTLVD